MRADTPSFGEIEQDGSGDHIRCHVCGDWFVSLAAHVLRAHEITAAEYREAFGLNKRQPLMAPTECKRRKANREHLLKFQHLKGEPNRVGNPGPHRAQQAKSIARVHATEEYRQAMSDALAGKPKPYMAARNRALAERYRETRQCIVCGAGFRIKRSSPNTCCSSECRSKRRSELMKNNRLNPNGRAGRPKAAV